jgi:hypothetical protein
LWIATTETVVAQLLCNNPLLWHREAKEIVVAQHLCNRIVTAPLQQESVVALNLCNNRDCCGNAFLQ